MKPASGYAHGSKATPQIAIAALNSAMTRGEMTQAGSVFLFLSTHFQQNIDECLNAVMQHCGSIDVIGASAAGVFTEQDWSLDSPAAAALVLPPNHPRPQSSQSHLVLAAPNAINQFWLNDGSTKFGGIAGDATGKGQYALWQAGQQRVSFTQTPLSARALIVSDGIKILSPDYTITASSNLHLTTLDHCAALDTLTPYLQQYQQESLLARISNEKQTVWVPLIACDAKHGSVMLAHELPLGATLNWGYFDTQAASKELSEQIAQATGGQAQPGWGLVFSSHRRVMAGNGISEPDWEAIRKALPDMPFAGFYGNGQIIPPTDTRIDKHNRIADNSVLLALFD
ncbi:FIST C-terminal domain-containing protein [Chitinibacter sp. S2-10]|uniref:FIST C-terminal domain-containing protein n=1 Tax=Chitinibacter sp. S2-10 TaxID=3373597 RepID=UPI003977D40C